ncbi:hypothetical protein BASA61_009596 [Batrachochytrium salamandrivorans]|nr:hypothetical protein BASA61_009596 [Batrachochytrium salamandrivorans]
MAHLVVDCTHPTVFFARVDTQLLQAINDTRVQIFDCTLHTTTTTTTTTTTPASPSFSTTSSNSNPDSTGTSAIWDSMDIHTPIDNYQHSPRTTSQSSPSSPSSPSDFSIFSFSHFSPDTRFEPPISVAQQEIPRQAQDTVEENPTASRTTTTDTHTAAISSTPTPTQISYIGSDDILTVLLGGSLPGTNTAGNTEACPGQQWLTVDHCILCDQQLLSISIAHLVVECEQVTGHRIQSGLVPAIQKSRLRLLGRSTRSGCGECIYLAPRWSLKWQADLDQLLVGRGLWSMNLWGRGMIIG